VSLRTVSEGDLQRLYEIHENVANRGPYFPHRFVSEPVFRRRFQETGFWGEKYGRLLILDRDGEIVGHVEFFETVAYLDELELSYQIYSDAHRGKGYASEAVTLLTRYLFQNLKYNRVRLIIHPDNEASKRVATKCGYRHEGTLRGAWFHEDETTTSMSSAPYEKCSSRTGMPPRVSRERPRHLR